MFDREKYLQRRHFYNCTSVIHTIIQTSFDGEPSVLAIDAGKRVFKLDMCLENKRQITVVNQAFSSGSTKLCVTEDMMILTNCGYGITIINESDGLLRNYNLPNMTGIRSICVHPNGQLLTLNSKRLSMYQISKTTAPMKVWTVECSNEGYAICTDKKSGLIFATDKGQSLHIISEEGMSSLYCTYKFIILVFFSLFSVCFAKLCFEFAHPKTSLVLGMGKTLSSLERRDL